MNRCWLCVNPNCNNCGTSFTQKGNPTAREFIQMLEEEAGEDE